MKKNFENGLQHGLEQSWYSTGVVASESEWQEGLKHGHKRSWSPSGQLTQDNVYIEGELLAESYYHANGRLKLVKGYNSGELKLEAHWDVHSRRSDIRKFSDHRLATDVHKNGRKASETEYLGKKKHGVELHWDDNGSLIAEILFIDDVLILQMEWDGDGKLKTEKVVREGEVIWEDP